MMEEYLFKGALVFMSFVSLCFGEPLIDRTGEGTTIAISSGEYGSKNNIRGGKLSKWDQLEKEINKFSHDHNLDISVRYYEGNTSILNLHLNFKCSDFSKGHILIYLDPNIDQPKFSAGLTVYNFDLKVEKEKFFKFNKPVPFEESKFMNSLKKLIIEMMNFKNDNFDDVRKIKIPSNPHGWEIDSQPIDFLKKELDALPIPKIE
jgi:hypothetical protein